MQLKNFMTPKNFNFQKTFFFSKNTLVLMIKKMPLSFPSLKNEVVMTYFMLEGTKKMKSMSFHQYS